MRCALHFHIHFRRLTRQLTPLRTTNAGSQLCFFVSAVCLSVLSLPCVSGVFLLQARPQERKWRPFLKRVSDSPEMRYGQSAARAPVSQRPITSGRAGVRNRETQMLGKKKQTPTKEARLTHFSCLPIVDDQSGSTCAKGGDATLPNGCIFTISEMFPPTKVPIHLRLSPTYTRSDIAKK